MLSPVTLEAKKQGCHGRWIFQRSGRKGNCGHVMGEVAVCYIIGTADGAPRHPPGVQWGSFPTCPGTQFPVTVDFATKSCPQLIPANTLFAPARLYVRILYAQYSWSSVTSVNFSTHIKDYLIRENKIGRGLNIRPISSHTFKQKLYFIINK
jgi:hypothetical protein